MTIHPEVRDGKAAKQDLSKLFVYKTAQCMISPLVLAAGLALSVRSSRPSVIGHRMHTRPVKRMNVKRMNEDHPTD
jgi:hypothetical protein